MDSTIVIIKVKYEDTLRRFSASVSKEGLDLNMDGLRAKILSLFKFAPDAELQLTYVDEDGDVVALVDDEDLRDVWRQSLNPLRVSVSLTTEKSGKPSAGLSGSSTPLRSPPLVLQNLNSGVSEILKSIPEPLRESLSKLSSDLASKATSTSPNLGEIVDSFSKFGLSYLNQHSETQGEASKDPQGSKVSVAPVEVSQNVKSGELSSKTKKVFGMITKTDEAKKVAGGVEIAVSGAPGPEPAALVAPSGSAAGDSLRASGSKPSSLKDALPGKGKEVKKKNLYDLRSKGVGLPYGGAPPFASISPINIKDASGPSEVHPDGLMNWGGIRNNPSMNPFVSSFYPGNMNECPFTGMPVGNETASPQNAFRESPYERIYSHNDGIFHRGVRCDGCGVHPITGPRFKSKVKEDYDLCSICFGEIGNDADYMRIDRPVIYRHPLSFKGLYNHHSQVLRHPTLPPVLRGGFGAKPNRPKLDSRFIQDVNILDGTLMAPSTTFTKIWRMRNNGTIVWPQGCQLVWIGGDRLTGTLSVGLEIAALGLPVHHEIDVAVDFVAPELPGRYISYWRMASPSGQKFGQRVWVLLQVDASMKEPVRETVHGFNLNWPPASDGVTAPEAENSIPDPEPEPMVEDVVVSEQQNSSVLGKEHEANFPINDSLLIGEGALNFSPSGPSSSAVSYPIIDRTEDTPPATPISVPLPPPLVEVEHTTSEEVSRVDIAVEESLLKELEDMGFKEVDLNKKVLRLNKYDLEQSVDDLCGVSEWDPMLEELGEMGFRDKETNKRLLQKNNGSIKRVVLDLIAGERD